LLISMVPLYTISQDAFERKVRFELDGELKNGVVMKQQNGTGQWIEPEPDSGKWKTLDEKDLQPNWFSDGGICSNFPIHFFDAWLPTHPTFGVNLTSQLAEGSRNQADKVRAIRNRSSYAAQQTHIMTKSDDAETYKDPDVYLPSPESDPSPEWIPIPGVIEFFKNIFSTAQNYRDNMQAMLPSYRERIVQIRLSDDEGGLNLDMPSETIERVFGKGSKAGDVLCDPKKFKFEYHQWVRFRVLMKQMEASLNEMNKVIRDNEIYKNLVNEERKFDSTGYPYPPGDDKWLGEVINRLLSIGKEIERWKPRDLFVTAKNPPVPEPKLRVTPEF
jgi:hypothetical protein